MGFQWSQDFTSESFGAFQYAEAVRFLFFSKHLSSKEDSEIFTLAFLIQTCQKNLAAIQH